MRTMQNQATWIQTAYYIKTEDIFEDITNDVEKRFDTSDSEVNRPLFTRKNKKMIGLMKYRSNDYDRIYNIQAKNIFLFNG